MEELSIIAPTVGTRILYAAMLANPRLRAERKEPWMCGVMCAVFNTKVS